MKTRRAVTPRGATRTPRRADDARRAPGQAPGRRLWRSGLRLRPRGRSRRDDASRVRWRPEGVVVPGWRGEGQPSRGPAPLRMIASCTTRDPVLAQLSPWTGDPLYIRKWSRDPLQQQRTACRRVVSPMSDSNRRPLPYHSRLSRYLREVGVEPRCRFAGLFGLGGLAVLADAAQKRPRITASIVVTPTSLRRSAHAGGLRLWRSRQTRNDTGRAAHKRSQFISGRVQLVRMVMRGAR